MQDQLFNILMQKDEITWQSLIYDLVKSEQMDPWDIDISLLSKKYLDTIKKLKEHNFFISGKVILASAILLKLKSHKLVTEEIANFDSILYQSEEELDELNLEDYEIPREEINAKLTVKTPLARKRKVSLNDLLSALQKALEKSQRRVLRTLRDEEVNVKVPEKKVDISEIIKQIYEKIINFFKFKKEDLTFTKLVNSDKREDKIFTLIPLLHLDNQERISLEQEKPFGEIKIKLNHNI